MISAFGRGERTPPPLSAIIAEFQAAEEPQRLQLLLDYAQRLPELPEGYRDTYQLDEVVECQVPLFLAAEFDDDSRVAEIFFAAPEEVPTTRGFASIIQHGLSGQSYETILSTPADIGVQLGLGRLLAPMRLRGVTAMCDRVKKKVLEHAG